MGQILANPYIAVIVLVALAFDYINGFHDAANSVATIVGTRVLRPYQAVLWAAFFNFVAAWVFGVHIANTVAKWVNAAYVTPDIILAGLGGAILWNVITWLLKLPTSSSHALLGGFVGAALASAGKWSGVIATGKVAVTAGFILIAPCIGFAMGTMLLIPLSWLLKNAFRHSVGRSFKIIQLCSAAAYSLGHGTNDAQKTMGIIAALLYASIWKSQQSAFAAGNAEFPFWIVLACHVAMGVGTLSGGWRIIHTMSSRLTKLRSYQGACAESAAAISLFVTAAWGIAVSTTHTIVGAIVGVGAVRRISAVRWAIAGEVVWAWILTIPCAAIMGAVGYGTIFLVRTIF
ncbi:MAG: inorganic phosphate transporter [Candidatus Sungbacteria bacterium]|nr:inorganic phosphate transporter [bacterium]MDZ4260163.1 inorganic phosphate transporter [Candidatus Sungbacteria bacterium]